MPMTHLYNMKKKFFISLFALAFLFFSAFSSLWVSPVQASVDPCDNLSSDAGKEACKTCLGNADDPTGFWTGIGCIPTNPMAAIGKLMNLLLGISAVFVFAQILIGAFKLMTSRGDTKGVQDAKERITNSVIAMLFILFSVSILEFIGVDVLSIPGFFDNPNASTSSKIMIQDKNLLASNTIADSFVHTTQLIKML